MSLVQEIANKSLRDADVAIASKVDELAASPIQDVSVLASAINELKEQVRALNVTINGEPPIQPTVDKPAPTTPV